MRAEGRLLELLVEVAEFDGVLATRPEAPAASPSGTLRPAGAHLPSAKTDVGRVEAQLAATASRSFTQAA